MTTPAINPRATHMIIAVNLLTGMILLVFSSGGLYTVFGLGPILIAAAGMCGLQKTISVHDGFLLVRFVVGEFRYPVQDIREIRSADGTGPVRTFLTGRERLDIITKSGRKLTVFPIDSGKLVSELSKWKKCLEANS